MVIKGNRNKKTKQFNFIMNQTSNQCKCSQNCTKSIIITEKMISDLYSKMQDYLPEDIQKQYQQKQKDIPTLISCSSCYQSIITFEHLVNLLYCYMGQYLPEQLHKPEVHNKTAHFNCRESIEKLKIMMNQLYCYMGEYLPQELQISHIIQLSQSRQFSKKELTPTKESKPKGKKPFYTLEFKKEKVEQVLSHVQNGQTLIKACQLSNIGERSFSRWRQMFKKGQFVQNELSSENNQDEDSQ